MFRALATEARGPRPEAREQLGGHVDVLVNNARVYPGGPTESLDDDTVDALLATNIRAPHVLVAALAPGLAERGSGHIVNIGPWWPASASPSWPSTPPRRPRSSS